MNTQTTRRPVRKVRKLTKEQLEKKRLKEQEYKKNVLRKKEHRKNLSKNFLLKITTNILKVTSILTLISGLVVSIYFINTLPDFYFLYIISTIITSLISTSIIYIISRCGESLITK